MKEFKLLRLGVSEGMDHEFRRVTMLSNVVYLLIVGIIFIFLVVNIDRYLGPQSISDLEHWIPFGLLSISLAGLVLNHFQQQLLSKGLFLFTWIFFTIILVPITRGTTESAFITVGLYAVVASVMVQILFSWRRERIAYITLSIATWLIILFYVDFLEYYRVPGDHNVLYQSGFGRWRLLVILIAVFFNGALVYMLRVNNQLNHSLMQHNETIESQNQQLAAQREKLVALAMQLREKVDSTHDQLNEQSLKLTEYTYFNSHILRAPVSRIRGLIHLLSLNLDPREEVEVRDLLTKSMKELDDAIREITEKLTERTQ